MRVRVNGEALVLDEALTLAALLASRGTDPRHVAVAVNERCVPRSRLADTALVDGDAVEILAPMQGG